MDNLLKLANALDKQVEKTAGMTGNPSDFTFYGYKKSPKDVVKAWKDDDFLAHEYEDDWADVPMQYMGSGYLQNLKLIRKVPYRNTMVYLIRRKDLVEFYDRHFSDKNQNISMGDPKIKDLKKLIDNSSIKTYVVEM